MDPGARCLSLSSAERLKKRILFAGRLADYKYYNMDQAVARALVVFERQVAPDAAINDSGVEVSALAVVDTGTHLLYIIQPLVCSLALASPSS